MEEVNNDERKKEKPHSRETSFSSRQNKGTKVKTKTCIKCGLALSYPNADVAICNNSKCKMYLEYQKGTGRYTKAELDRVPVPRKKVFPWD